MMLELTPLVEPISIDEAFLDLTGTERLHRASPAVTLARFARSVETEIGITISVGLSYAKFLAKIASDLDKPRGFSMLGRADAVSFIAARPITILPGVGRAAAERLAERGVRLVGDLARLPPEQLFALLGKDGPRLLKLSRGEDDRRIEPDREAKSVSAETTFDADIADIASLEPYLWRMAEKTATRLRKDNLAGRGVTLKLKTADFRLVTRSRQLNEPTQLAQRLYDTARELLLAEPKGVRYRLIGVGADHLADGTEADRGDLADSSPPRQAAMEKAIDRLRDKFGRDAVVKGVGLGRDGAISRKPTGP
jgi:DNA polymerase-4